MRSLYYDSIYSLLKSPYTTTADKTKLLQLYKNWDYITDDEYNELNEHLLKEDSPNV